MEKNRLYETLKNKICVRIYDGTFPDGVSLPPERKLAESFSMSRVTVRKALELLQKDGIIESVQGSGNIVRLRQTGYSGSMDIIALVAPAQNPFFSTFIDYFQQKAQEYDSLVLFKQNPRYERVEDTIFKLYQKNIRNAVIWLEDLTLDVEYIRRLRGLGMNMVFFDISLETPYADCVYSDNQDAMFTLCRMLKLRGMQDVVFIGWDNYQLTSVSEREKYFREKNDSGNPVYHISWAEKEKLKIQIERFLDGFQEHGNKIPEAILCGDGEISIALRKEMQERDMQEVLIASVDDFPESKELSLSVYGQCFEKLAQKVYECLQFQNKHPHKWKASTYPIKGQLVER